MIATTATCMLFSIASLPHESCAKTETRFMSMKKSCANTFRGVRSQQTPSHGDKAKLGIGEGLASEEPRRHDILINPFDLGKIVQDGLIFRRNFSIRSYEIGANRTVSIDTLMNYLQETTANHMKTVGFFHGFGVTREMYKKNLVWVVTKIQILVDRYPIWGDVVQVDTWFAASGKNGIRCDWTIVDCKTRDVLTRASSVWVLMNKETRRLTKLSNEVRVEMGCRLVDLPPAVDEDNIKIPKLDESIADYIRSDLIPRWSDLDQNQHVNNAKYIDLILESVPISILASHELSNITVEYKRECGRDNVLKSLTHVLNGGEDGGEGGGLVNFDCIVCEHLLQIVGGADIVKARSKWKLKFVDGFGNLGQ